MGKNKPVKKFSGTVEEQRLLEAREKQIPWRKWGPYLSERQWGNGARGLQRVGHCVGLFYP
jgi:hypothetical protein